MSAAQMTAGNDTFKQEIATDYQMASITKFHNTKYHDPSNMNMLLSHHYEAPGGRQQQNKTTGLFLVPLAIFNQEHSIFLVSLSKEPVFPYIVQQIYLYY